MMKSSELLILVDAVEEAVKFYTEKLAFDITDLEVHKDTPTSLLAAHLRKGKCFITFRTPHVEELAEFSFIKRCASRCVGLQVEMKKGIEKYFARCQKKGVKVVNELKDTDGYKSFALRDPFGTKLIFLQAIEGKDIKPSLTIAGIKLSEQDLRTKKESDIVTDIIDHVKTFSITRRAGKKFAKLKYKQLMKK